MADVLCARPGCGHPPDWHRHDDSATPGEAGHLLHCAPADLPGDSSCPFRCVGYDVTVDGSPPADPCTCPDYLEPAA